MSHKAIFLDRDGTIIVDKVYLNDPDKIEYLPNTVEGLRLLRDLGFMFFVVTNQSGIPRGLVKMDKLNEIHQKINHDLGSFGVHIQSFYYAPFLTDSNHYSRKPNPGMLYYAHQDYGVDFENSWMIGDRMTDVEAGHRVGCKSILLSGNEKPEDFQYDPPNYVADHLLDAAQFIEKF